MANLFKKQFIVVAGKGGVGKTTISIALAHCAAGRGIRTLLCLSNAPPRYSRLLGGVTLGPKILKIRSNFFVVNLDPVASREEYSFNVLRNHTLHNLIFGSRVVNNFLDAIPGLAEWAILGKATHHALNIVDGRPEYDLVIFDSPATGHGLDVLGLPKAIIESVPTGRILNEAKERVELMSDPNRCEILPVTIPEEMPVNEVIELITELHIRKLSVKRLVINMMPPENSQHLANVLTSIPWKIRHQLLPVEVAVGRHRQREQCLERLAATTSLPMIKLPLLKISELDEAAALHLAKCLDKAISA